MFCEVIINYIIKDVVKLLKENEDFCIEQKMNEERQLRKEKVDRKQEEWRQRGREMKKSCLQQPGN